MSSAVGSSIYIYIDKKHGTKINILNRYKDGEPTDLSENRKTVVMKKSNKNNKKSNLMETCILTLISLFII